jgi:hypothetical protein
MIPFRPGPPIDFGQSSFPLMDDSGGSSLAIRTNSGVRSPLPMALTGSAVRAIGLPADPGSLNGNWARGREGGTVCR